MCKFMNVIVAHHFWDRPGGGELVCSSTVYAFNRLNFKPSLVSLTEFDRSKYVEWFGIDLSKYDVIYLSKIRLHAFGLYQRFLVWIPTKKAIEKYNPSIVFIDTPTYKLIEKIIRERKINLIEYIHFPLEAEIMKKFKGMGLYYKEDPYIAERYGKFPLSLYWWGFAKLYPLFTRRNPFEIALHVLTNSRWCAEIVSKIYGEKPMILNPPIAPNVEIVEKSIEFSERIDMIVMLGRFSEEKRYAWVVKEVMPKLRKEIEKIKLCIFGSTRTRTSELYFNKIEKIATEKGFKISRSLANEADIYLIPDAPRKLINEVMDKSKVFLHATINEHWGIAVAEAMARGLPVVVHKSGGTWSDLVNEGVYGCGYLDVNEVVENIAEIVANGSIWNYYSIKSIERAKELTLEKFIEKFTEIIRKIKY